MRPFVRKILYAVTFEAGGILLGGLVLHLISSAQVDRTLALGWSMMFNSAFEA